MTWCNAKIKGASKKMKHTEKPGTYGSPASALGRHNTPPLREDLVPRSRMAPEGKRKRKRRGKLSCFFDQWVKPRTLRGWANWKKEYKGDERDCKQSVRKRNKEHYENLKVAKTWIKSLMDKKELKPLWLKRDERGRIRAALQLNMEGI